MSEEVKAASEKPEGYVFGRPTLYRPAYCEQARKLYLLGYTDAQLADFYKISIQTLYDWWTAHPDFLEACNSGKDPADAEVVESLYQRAKGYSHKSEKIFQANGEILRAETVQHYPPDTAAASLWLRNRQSGRWRDRTEVEVPGLNGLAERLAEARKRLEEAEKPG